MAANHTLEDENRALKMHRRRRRRFLLRQKRQQWKILEEKKFGGETFPVTRCLTMNCY
eukprot:gene6486-7228_t